MCAFFIFVLSPLPKSNIKTQRQNKKHRQHNINIAQTTLLTQHKQHNIYTIFIQHRQHNIYTTQYQYNTENK